MIEIVWPYHLLDGHISELCVGVHHKKTPKFEEINKNTGEVLLSAICLNSGYTSRIMVLIIQSLFIHSLGITDNFYCISHTVNCFIHAVITLLMDNWFVFQVGIVKWQKAILPLNTGLQFFFAIKFQNFRNLSGARNVNFAVYSRYCRRCN